MPSNDRILTPGGSSIPQNVRRRGDRPRHNVIAERRIVTVKFGKRVTENEIAGYAAALRADRSFQPEFSEIVDLRDVEDLDLRGNEMMELADKIDPFSFEAKRAFVVRNSVQSHAARMHQILRIAKENIFICHSLEEAECWIAGIPATRAAKATK